MKLALHGMVTLHSNIISDIRIAAEAGYEGLEIHTDKLWRFLNHNDGIAALKNALAQHNIKVNAIDVIGDVENPDAEVKARVLESTKVLSILAKELQAPVIQLNGFEALNSLSVEDNIRITASHIKEIAKIGAEYGIRFQYEGAAWTPIASLQDCMRLVEAVGEDNFGLVIDFWHFWASRGAEPEDIAKLDKSIIYGVHCCGGIRPPMHSDGTIAWEDEREFRGYFPVALSKEEKERALAQEVRLEYLPVDEWVDAIFATGYDGWVSGEFLNDALWEHDNLENAKIMYKNLKSLFRI